MAQAEPQIALGEEKIKFLDASVRDSFSPSYETVRLPHNGG